ncbi:MAG: acyl-CoA thioesterase [Planctomycetota bacterium]
MTNDNDGSTECRTSSPWHFSCSVRPRYGEVDRMGIVYHAHYLVYFDIARTEFLRASGSAYSEIEQRGIRLAVVHAEVEYLSPARYDQELSVHVLVTEISGASLRFAYQLRNTAGALLARAQTRLACLDSRNRPTRLPIDISAKLASGMNAQLPLTNRP